MTPLSPSSESATVVSSNFKAGDRFEVLWNLEGRPTPHVWGATLLAKRARNKRSSSSSDSWTLRYDPFPEMGYKRTQSEKVTFLSECVLMNEPTNETCVYRRVGKECPQPQEFRVGDRVEVNWLIGDESAEEEISWPATVVESVRPSFWKIQYEARPGFDQHVQVVWFFQKNILCDIQKNQNQFTYKRLDDERSQLFSQKRIMKGVANMDENKAKTPKRRRIQDDAYQSSDFSPLPSLVLATAMEDDDDDAEGDKGLPAIKTTKPTDGVNADPGPTAAQHQKPTTTKDSAKNDDNSRLSMAVATSFSVSHSTAIKNDTQSAEALSKLHNARTKDAVINGAGASHSTDQHDTTQTAPITNGFPALQSTDQPKLAIKNDLQNVVPVNDGQGLVKFIDRSWASSKRDEMADAMESLRACWWMVDLHFSRSGVDQGATPLVARCMDVHCWSEKYARRVLEAYHQFLCLKKDFQDWNGSKVLPCLDVEKMWRTHSTSPHYTNDCILLLNHELHVNSEIDLTLDDATQETATHTALKDRFGPDFDEELWKNLSEPESDSECHCCTIGRGPDNGNALATCGGTASTTTRREDSDTPAQDARKDEPSQGKTNAKINIQVRYKGQPPFDFRCWAKDPLSLLLSASAKDIGVELHSLGFFYAHKNQIVRLTASSIPEDLDMPNGAVIDCFNLFDSQVAQGQPSV